MFNSCCLTGCHGAVLLANVDSYYNLIKKYDLTIVKFSAEWCHFSRELSPIFQQTSEAIKSLTEVGKAALITVDCEESRGLCTQENIRKFPTIKVTRYGKVLKREYRDQRSVEAFVNFINEHLKSPLQIIDAENTTPEVALSKIRSQRNAIIGLFNNLEPNNSHRVWLEKIASLEIDNCAFYLIHNLTISDERLVFWDALTSNVTAVKILNNIDFPSMEQWITQQAITLVRELTFKNAEEITEENLPLLILFYHPSNRSIVSQFTDFINKFMSHQRGTVNILVADGNQFSHPLSHLRKSTKDLPLICLDSFSHMYLFPGAVELAISHPKYLNQFIEDLKSGKLHLEFHYGPGAGTTSSVETKKPPQTSPPESKFRLLGPSPLRYTILRDEL